MGNRKPYTTIRALNEDGSLDEIVGYGAFHLEQLDDDVWFLSLGAVVLTLGRDRRKVTAVPLDYSDWDAARMEHAEEPNK